LVALTAAALLASCAGPEVASHGAMVSVYKPNPNKEGLACSSGGEEGIPFMYVGNDTVNPVSGGTLSATDKEVIAQHSRAVIGETKLISPVTMREEDGAYPVLSITVHQFSSTTTKEGDRFVTKGIFYAGFSIRQYGAIECSTAAPMLVEKRFETPSHKKDSIPSDLKVKEAVVKEAVRRVIRQLVPVKSEVLRPVKSSGDLAAKTSAMINGGNCDGAYEISENYVDNPSCKDADALYNAGVATECMAWGQTNDMKTQAAQLTKALKYYKRAAALKPSDSDMNKAVGDVSYTIKTAYSSMERQTKTKKSMDKTFEQLKAPGSY
jgi:hypothetical protein